MYLKAFQALCGVVLLLYCELSVLVFYVDLDPGLLCLTGLDDTVLLPLFSFTLSVPANLPSFSQSFGCKTASHFVEFLCRINVCNCKALGWHFYLKGREEVTGSKGCTSEIPTPSEH